MRLPSFGGKRAFSFESFPASPFRHFPFGLSSGGEPPARPDALE
jgi:hypothetical protein